MIDPNTAAVLAQFGVDPSALEPLLFSAAAISVLTLVTVLPTGRLAAKKGRSRNFWMLFALTLPVLPLLLLWLLPALVTPEARPALKATVGPQP